MPGKRREALTQARTPGAITTHGEPVAARGLARALDVARVSEETARALTHGFHSYPARMHPVTARRALEVLAPARGALVLDPFCGSGTVLVEALLCGARPAGVDASPLALLVANARVWDGTRNDRRALVERARSIAARAIEEGKAARRAGHRRVSHATDAARDELLRGWFDPHVRRELELLARLCGECPGGQRDLLRAVLSSILIKASRRASDTRPETAPRRVARGAAARWFAERAEELCRGLDALHAAVPRGTPRPALHLGDARDLRMIAPASVAAALTSPPYAGTYDYHDHHALRAAFLGLPAAGFAEREIGARRAFAGDPERALDAYQRDLGQVLRELARVLAPGGRAAILIGDSLAGRPPRALRVDAAGLLARLTYDAGLRFVAMASAPRAPLGAGERAAFAQLGKREHLILLSSG